MQAVPDWVRFLPVGGVQFHIHDLFGQERS